MRYADNSVAFVDLRLGEDYIFKKKIVPQWLRPCFEGCEDIEIMAFDVPAARNMRVMASNANADSRWRYETREFATVWCVVFGGSKCSELKFLSGGGGETLRGYHRCCFS